MWWWGGGGGVVFWTWSLRPEPSFATQKTPGVFKIMHPGSGGGGAWYVVFLVQGIAPLPKPYLLGGPQVGGIAT